MSETEQSNGGLERTQRCWCGAYTEDTSEEEGIRCTVCGDHIHPAELRDNGYEWNDQLEVWARE